MNRKNGRNPKKSNIIKANSPPLADFTINFRTKKKTVVLHIPHSELDKLAYFLYVGLKKEGIACSIEEKI